MEMLVQILTPKFRLFIFVVEHSYACIPENVGCFMHVLAVGSGER
jgi:hypothetical protein